MFHITGWGFWKRNLVTPSPFPQEGGYWQAYNCLHYTMPCSSLGIRNQKMCTILRLLRWQTSRNWSREAEQQQAQDLNGIKYEMEADFMFCLGYNGLLWLRQGLHWSNFYPQWQLNPTPYCSTLWNMASKTILLWSASFHSTSHFMGSFGCGGPLRISHEIGASSMKDGSHARFKHDKVVTCMSLFRLKATTSAPSCYYVCVWGGDLYSLIYIIFNLKILF